MGELFADTIVSHIISATHTVRLKPSREVERPTFGISLKLSGETVYHRGSDSLSFPAGSVLFLPQGSQYECLVTEPGEAVTICFSCLNPESLPNTLMLLDTSGNPALRSLFREIEQCWTFKKTGYYPKCLSLLYAIFAALAQSDPQKALPRTAKKNINNAILYLEANYADPSLNIDKLAAKVKLSSSHFCKLFTDIYGISPGRYLQLIRISKAKDFLTTGDFTVSEIAELTGFSSVYYFSKAFKKETGISPSQYTE